MIALESVNMAVCHALLDTCVTRKFYSHHLSMHYQRALETTGGVHRLEVSVRRQTFSKHPNSRGRLIPGLPRAIVYK